MKGGVQPSLLPLRYYDLPMLSQHVRRRELLLIGASLTTLLTVRRLPGSWHGETSKAAVPKFKFLLVPGRIWPDAVSRRSPPRLVRMVGFQ